MKIKLLKTMVINESVEFPYYDLNVPDELGQKLVENGLAEAVPVAASPTVLEKVQIAEQVKHGKARKTPEDGQGNPGQPED